MSFILDALKKSENERQSQVSTEFSTVSGPADAPRAPRWLWLLGALLLINLVVVAGLLLRPAPDAPPPAAATPAAPAAPAAPAIEAAAELVAPPITETTPVPTFADRIEEARRSRPAAESPEAVIDAVPAAGPVSADPGPDVPVSGGIAGLPTLMELQAGGDLTLPPLHIDLHVYNDDPARRFVSINMNKYRENEALREGPTVSRITREGVILDYQGRTFALFQ